MESSAVASQKAADVAWHAQSASDVTAHLEADPDAGLTATEADARLERHGSNVLDVEERESILMRFLRQFHDVLIYILMGASVVTALLGEWIDSGVIMAVVLINAIIGFVQEGKAEEALESLRDMLSPQATVLRDGERTTIKASDVVPGDIVLVESGDQIPADVRWLDANNLSVEEAILTGESMPVDKHTDAVSDEASIGDRASMGFSGTIVRRGRGRGVVVARA